MRRELIKVYVDEQVKTKLEERAGRVSLSSFVSGLIDSYFEEYPGLSDAELKRIEANMPKAGDTVRIKKPARFVTRDDVVAAAMKARASYPAVAVTNITSGPTLDQCEHGAYAYECKKWGCKFYEIPNGRR